MKKPREILESLAKPFARRSGRGAEEDLQSIAARDQKHFSYDVLAKATSNFCAKNKLGEGGFGSVYKGRLEDGREIAVKKLSRGSKQGCKEFMNEAILLSQVQHKNVVNLYGYCAATASSGDESRSEKLLVYEFVPHESLDKLLFRAEKQRMLDWKKRMDIIAGVAKGLLYLHEDAHTTIIHRDIKASNVLLDSRWSPKIADFGMARLFPEDQTHVQTRVAGTNGYMAPEYVMHGKLSTKADVFSFGVLVLEIITGRKSSTYMSTDSQTLLEWAWRLHQRNRSLEMVDETLRPWEATEAEQMETCIHLGLLCAQRDPNLRPDMRRVGLALSKRSNSLEQPTMPGLPFTFYKARSSDHVPSSRSSSSSTSRPTFRSSSHDKMSSSAEAAPRCRGKAPLEDV
ncbi:cysteine-rich receptor-like protein kinase 43 [Wolffia australiana]